MNRRPKINVANLIGDPQPSTYIEKLVGLTAWTKTSVTRPPWLGWWRCWSPMGRADRRWWNGHVWSVPVHANMSDAEVLAFQHTASKNTTDILWCGLRGPHPARYLEYRLTQSPRLTHWSRIHDTR